MEIHSFRLLVTDDDVTALTAKLLRDHDTIENLKVRLTPEGILLQGDYPTSFFKVHFETIWHLEAAGPAVEVRLATVKVAGLPAGMLRGALMKMVRDAVASQPGMLVKDETIYIHVCEAARAHGVDLRLHFLGVQMSAGSAVIEAGGVS